jgi:hypothetical protein
VDFIVVHYSRSEGLVLNVADVAAYAGLAMILRTGYLIALAIRRDVDVFDVVRKGAVLSIFADRSAARTALGRGEQATRPARAEREVPIPSLREGPVGDAPHARVPMAEVDGVIDIGVVRRTRRLALDDAIPRPLGTQRTDASDQRL